VCVLDILSYKALFKANYKRETQQHFPKRDTSSSLFVMKQKKHFAN